MKDLKKYLIAAHELLLKNKKYFFGSLALYGTAAITISLSTQSDPYGVFSMISMLSVYAVIIYALVIQVFIYNKLSKTPLPQLDLKKLWMQGFNKGSVIIAWIVIVLSAYALAIYLFIDLPFHTKYLDLIFMQPSKSDDFFGFFLVPAIACTVLAVICIPLYFVPVIYFLNKLDFGGAVKESVKLFKKHWSFVISVASLSLLSQFIYTLITPINNMLLLSLMSIQSTYIEMIVLITLLLFYKEHYKLASYTTETSKAPVKIDKRSNKFLHGLNVISAILVAEFSLLLTYGLLLETFKKYTNEMTYGYFILVAIIPLLLFVLKKKTKLFRMIWVIIVVWFIGLVTVLAMQPEQKQTETSIKKEFSSEELWKGVNDKREENGVVTLEKNKWACRVAELELVENLKVGNGYFADSARYEISIKKVIGEFDGQDTDVREPMPQFDREYLIYSDTLDQGIQSLVESQDNKKLFAKQDITYGCAAAKKGYGVIITTFDPLYDPNVEEVNNI